MTEHEREQEGQQIGHYKLLRAIGEGGFGTVWMAEQEEPVQRRVALKVIKLGMDTKQVITRFAAERQALALMDHPNIAKVFDAGSTDTGRPYFVMEYIEGVTMLDYCDEHKLDTKARLELFTKVCQAIQHAHQKGIIHRDIKPSNVLITLQDGEPVPKVIDFGIAKATKSELTQDTLFTEHHQMVGTPAYMSPEQVAMSGIDIDTRADIYSLGVLLYELLTGTTPFDIKRLLRDGYAEMMRVIREQEPHKPSTRLSTLGAIASEAAELRRVDVKKLGLQLRGDLDWIVMKCLEKDRARRYETASGLAMDIVRHLEDQPVVAGPPSAGYRVRKFVKRHQGGVIAGSAIAVMLVIGVISLSLLLRWALTERKRADQAATDATIAALAEQEAKLAAQVNEQRAIAEAKRAERELARATEVKRLIAEMLQRVDPGVAQGADTTLLEGILDDTAKRLEEGAITDERIAAELHLVLGDVYRRLGLYPAAERHTPVAFEIRERVLGVEHPDTLDAMHALALLHNYLGRFADAEALLEQELAIRKRLLGDDEQGTLNAMHKLAFVYYRERRYDEAETLYLETLEITRRVFGDEHRSLPSLMGDLSLVYTAQRRYAEAESQLVRVLEICPRVVGAEHPDTLVYMTALADTYIGQRRYADAETLHLKALDIRRRVLGDQHPATLRSMRQLATVYLLQGNLSKAEPLYVETLEIQRQVLGDAHPLTVRTVIRLVGLYQQQRRFAEPGESERRLFDLMIAAAERPEAGLSTLNDASWYLLTVGEELRDPPRALRYAERLYATATEKGVSTTDVANYLDTLALAQYTTGDTAAAVESMKRAVALNPDDADLAQSLANFEAAAQAQAQGDEQDGPQAGSNGGSDGR